MAKGRRIGSKNYSAQPFTKFGLRQILSNMSMAVNKGSRKSLEEIAPSFLAYIAKTEPQFNDYTGNLANAYAATLFIRRKYVKTFYHDTGRHAKGVHFGPKGGVWVPLLPPARHKIRRKRLLPESERSAARHKHEWQVEGVPAKRYLKPWEKMNGYRGRSAHRGASYSAGAFGSWKAQNFLRIENQAPYAEMVQQGRGGTHRHYRVLRGSAVHNMTQRATELVKTVTLRELKEAGFKVR